MSTSRKSNRALSIADMLNPPPDSPISGMASAGYIQYPESALRSTANHPRNNEEQLSKQAKPNDHRKPEVQHQDQEVTQQERQGKPRQQPVQHQDERGHQRDLTLQQVKPASQQVEKRKIVPPFHFSPSRGSLHDRRRSRSTSPEKAVQHPVAQEEPPTPINIQFSRPVIVPAARVIDYPTPPGSSSNNRPAMSIPPQMTQHSQSKAPVVEKPFNIFQSILKHQDLVLTLSGLLPIDDFIGLYAISKDFHTMVNRNATTFMKHYARVNAPGSSQVFQFRFYPKLCMKDPTPRPNDDRPDQIRTVPNFRWLRMVIFRHNIVRDMILIMAADGMRMPEPTHLTMKKIWLLLDLPYNDKRLAMIHSQGFWTDRDLYRATLWFVKLDMLFGDPITGTGNEVELRKLLLAQRSLTVLWRTLRRELLQTESDVLQLYARAWYEPPQFSDADGASVLGIPAHLVGRMNHEGWGRGPNRLLRPDQLVMSESIRRELEFDKSIMNMMSYGFVNEKSWERLPHPGYHRVQEVQKQQLQKKIDEEVEREVAARRSGKGKAVETIAGPSSARPPLSAKKGKATFPPNTPRTA